MRSLLRKATRLTKSIQVEAPTGTLAENHTPAPTRKSGPIAFFTAVNMG
jgi:hypothetical protein